MQTSNSFQRNRRPQSRPVDSFGGRANQNNAGQNISRQAKAPAGSSIGAFEGIVAHAQAPRAAFKKSGEGSVRPVQKPASRSASLGGPVSSQTPRTGFGVSASNKPSLGGSGASSPLGQSSRNQRSGGFKRQGPKPAGKKGGQRNRRFVPVAASRFEVKSNGEVVPPIGEKILRIIPLGGQEEVGRNMTVFEYGNDIVIIDMGMQFPEEDMPGIDYIVPNVNYLKGKEKNIRGVVFTHGHLDHIGAAPILLKKLNYPTIVGRDFTLALIQRKAEDYDKGSSKQLKIVRVKSLADRIKLGVFEVRFFEVEHSIMDAMGVALVTPNGSIIHLGDWMISNEPLVPKDEEIKYDHLGALPQPTILMLESLGAIKKGMPPSETEVHRNLQNLIKSSPGRIIIGTFSSQVRRIAYLIEYAEQVGKKVAIEGYSMKMNIEVAKELGYLKAKNDTFITVADIHKYPDKQVVVICTGAQGESNAALTRIVTDNHRFIKLQKNDTIVFSSSVIPGNERTIQRLKDNLYRKCDNVIHSEIMEIHIGGHGTIWEIEEIIRQVKPTYILPVYANHFFIVEAARIAYRLGYPEKNVFVMDNGHVLEVPEEDKGLPYLLKEKADASYVFVDGLGIGDIGHVVLRDRQMLAQDGMVVVTVIIDSKTKNIIGNVQITSRGFIHVKENFDLVNETKRKVEKVVKDNTSRGSSIDWDQIRNQIREGVGQFLFTKTERRPMVLPVVIEV
ncbi:MAG: ribonuclease J [Candidatus Moranbacteria bacterium]|nr:ribonuclease J [Candidatus Moranbacteria bacterium]